MKEIFIINDQFTSEFSFGSICLIFAIVSFGVIANIINLIIFVKLGFKDTVNISLVALTICDLCSLLPLISLGVLTQPRLLSPDVTFVGGEIQFLASGWPHTILSKLTSWITAFIMVERCLCIAKPLKVKTLVTPFRVKFCLVLLSVIVVSGALPTYATHYFDWKFYPMLNRTLLGLVLTDNALEVTRVSNVLSNSVSALLSFTITASCTLVIVVQLNRKSKWRQSVAASSKRETFPSSSKENKAAKLVITLSAVFLISVLPSIMVVIGSAIDDNFGLLGLYRNLFNICYCVTFIMEALNSSVNIIVYYFMNSRFRETFRHLIRTV
ncbi:tachykinin-like peptides receptor 86C [Biomphalaria glabrata]|nr:tachykinin-like peptides receptor 86C [Biomphalaria glabrata]